MLLIKRKQRGKRVPDEKNISDERTISKRSRGAGWESVTHPENDWLLIAVLLVAAAGIYVAIQYYQKVSTQNAVAVVTVDGVEYGRYPLSEDHTETIRFEDGSYNRFAIQDGYVSMPEASCPDQICVHHNKISRNKETIVCLPDKVVITIENGEDSGIDILQH